MRSIFYLLLFSASMLLTNVTYPVASAAASNAETSDIPGKFAEVNKQSAPQKKPQHVVAGGQKIFNNY